MEDLTIVVIPIITSIISYLVARHTGHVELEKFARQQESEIKKLKHQQDIEIAKIREQSTQEITRISIELDKQAQLYEKNKQADMVAKVFDKVIEGDTSGLETLITLAQQLESGGFKKGNPGRHKRR